MTELPLQKRLRRVIMEITQVTDDEIVVDLPRWRENHPVKVKKSLIPESVLSLLDVGSWLIASVNAEADHEEDLEFHDFEIVDVDDSE